MAIIISNTTQFTSGTIEGLKLFFYSVLPGLFPFMLLTKLLTEIGFIFKISKRLDKVSRFLFGTPGVSFYAFFMSVVSGYPIGAKIISDLFEKQLINESDAKKMSVFCTTSGPIFVIGTVGSIMFKSQKIGLLLYTSHIASSVLFGIVFNLLYKNNNSNHNCNHINFKQNTPSNILSNAISNTINSLFIVGAYITIFYLVGEILSTLNIVDFASNILLKFSHGFGITKNTADGLVFGLLEVTRGTKILSLSPTTQNIMFASGILSFSGISIITQSMAFLKTAKIKTHFFIFIKSVHLLLSMFCCGLLIFICGI